MKALVTGGGGQLAHHLAATAPPDVELLAVARDECDITDRRSVTKVFDSYRPDVVINTAAFTAVDAAEDNRDLAFLVNAEGTANVARTAADHDARLIHISTDYVFDGDRSTPYPPDAPANPLSIYGASKLEGERLAISLAPATLVVRVGWLYSRTGKNFLSRIAGGTIEAPEVRVVRDQIGCPTSASEFAAVLWKATKAGIHGIYHWANRGSTTWFDFAKECETLGRDLGLANRANPRIVGATSDEFPARAKRPGYSVLDPTRLAEALAVAPAPWRDALREELLRPA